MPEAFRLGIAGLGIVGSGVIKMIQHHPDMIAARAGRRVEIACVSARDPKKKRDVDCSAYEWVKTPEDLIGRHVDAIVEVMGGADGPAHDLVKAALNAGIPVVSANKALLAHHGFELSQLAEQKGAALLYEAAVAGGIPAIKALREGFAGNEIRAVYGILNGTCNYILTAMRKTGANFEEVLKQAQAKGYAEADPAFDVDGIDAGHKLCLLSALAFGVKPDFDHLKIKGIRQINSSDIAFATELGYRIKLLGIARREGDKILQILEPCLVPEGSPIGGVEDVYNAVYIDGDFVGTQLLTGRGAGSGPTASAVLSDIIDLARGLRPYVFGMPAATLKPAQWANLDDTVARYYLRLMVLDQPGVIADISAILRDENISIESLIQHGRDPEHGVPVVLTTHETRHGAMAKACAQFKAMKAVVDEPCLIRIEDLE